MGKLVGGEYLLDLTPITIAESVDGETYTNITNQNVIKQLTNLKEYIRNPKAIKPVWVKFVNDEDDAVIVTRGSLSIVDDGEFDIDVSINGYKLKIHVEFTQVLNDDNVPIDDWYIDTNDAKYLFTSDAQSIGAITELPIFENIVDKDGNKRFIEGNVDIETITGVTKDYGKWSLSGTHLFIVLALSLENTTDLTNGQLLSSIELPSWICDKIVTLWSTAIVLNVFSARANDWTEQIFSAYLGKESETNITIRKSGALTLNADRKVRIIYDLLIDNE